MRKFLLATHKLFNISELERMAGLPKRTINLFLCGNRDLSDKHVAKIKTALNKVIRKYNDV